jgi:hypothetical protein
MLEKASAQNAPAFSQFQQARLPQTKSSAFGGGKLKPETALTQNSGHTRTPPQRGFPNRNRNPENRSAIF